MKNIIDELTKSNGNEEKNIWNTWLDNKTRKEVLEEERQQKPLGRPPIKHIVNIRKIWDIGTEHVIMQTVIQVDGDVITRIQRGMDQSKRAGFMQIHNQSIDIGLKHWRTMFDVLKQIGGSITKAYKK